MGYGLPDGVQHVRLRAVASQARQDEDGGPRGRSRVGGAAVVVLPVQRDLTAVGRADTFAVGHILGGRLFHLKRFGEKKNHVHEGDVMICGSSLTCDKRRAVWT